MSCQVAKHRWYLFDVRKYVRCIIMILIMHAHAHAIEMMNIHLYVAGTTIPGAGETFVANENYVGRNLHGSEHLQEIYW